jgi:hypothetical protein
MLSFCIKAILKIVCSVAACSVLCILAVLLLVLQSFSLGSIIGAVALVAFATIPIFLIREGWKLISLLVYRKDNKEFISYPAIVNSNNESKQAAFARNVMKDEDVFSMVANKMRRALPELPGLCDAQEELKNTPVLIKLCTFRSLQDEDRPNTKIRGDQSGNTLRIQWMPEDQFTSRLLLEHEIGHLVFHLVYPAMSGSDQHEYLAKAVL